MRQPCSRVFGRPLQEISQSALPPKVFRQTLCFLAKSGLTVSGLFDELRNLRKIQLLHYAYDADQDPLTAVGVLDPWTVAGVLRLWLSCLPEPLIPWELAHPLLLGASQLAPEQFTSQILTLLGKVPACNLAVLLPLTEFLHHYNLNHREAGLAAKFLPIYLGCLGSSGQLLQELRDAAEHLVDVLITDYRSISLSFSPGLRQMPATLHSPRSQSPSRRSRRSVRELSGSSFLPGRYVSPAGGRSSSRSTSPGPRQRLSPSSSRKPVSRISSTLPRPPRPQQLPPCRSLLPKHAQTPPALPCIAQTPLMIPQSRQSPPETAHTKPLSSQPQPQINSTSTEQVTPAGAQQNGQQSEILVGDARDSSDLASHLRLSSAPANTTCCRPYEPPCLASGPASHASLEGSALPRLHVRTSLPSREYAQRADIADQAIAEVVGELVSASTDSLLF